MSFGKATTVSLAGQVASLITTFLSGVIIARALGPSGKGTYSLVVLTYAFAVLIGNLGVPAFVASTAGKRRHTPVELLHNSVIMTIVSSVIVAVVYLLVREWTGQRSVLWPFFMILAVVTPAGLLREHLGALLQGMNRIGRFSVTKVVANAVTLILLAVFVWSRPSITTAVYCWIGGEVVATLVAVGLVIPIAAPGLNLSRPVLKESLKFGSAVCVGSLIGLASLRLDLFLVAYFLPASEVGLYSVATAASSVIMYLPVAMAVALLPRLSSANADESYALTARGCRFAIVWGVGCALFLGILGGVLISVVYGELFRPAATAMRILLPGTVIYGLAHITTAYYNGYVGRPFINTALAALSLLIGVALDVALIPRFGINGAAVASSVAYIVSMFVALFVFARVSGRSFLPLLAVGKRDFLEFKGFLTRNIRETLQRNA